MRPLVISHRTHMGSYPENSRAGLEAALASGVDGVEVDVRATRDHHIVLFHDRSLARTTGDPRNIDEVDYAEASALPLFSGPSSEVAHAQIWETQTIVPLEEALALCAARARLVIDVKQHGIAGVLEAMLHAYHGRTEAWVWTHEPAIAHECIDVLGRAIPVSLIVRPEQVPLWSAPEGIALARAEGLTGLLFEHPFVNAALIERVTAAGLTLHCGRTNDAPDVARILGTGPASICSDFPERVIAALDPRRLAPEVDAAVA